MARWTPDAPGRLLQAALELFEERGYDGTTVADIAARAGLTERTFFRYFTDKREVLMSGADDMRARLTDAIVTGEPGARPFDLTVAAIRGAGEFFDERRPWSRRRQAVLTANPALMERELIKLATLTRACGAALQERGVPEPTAGLAAQAGIAVFQTAFGRWIADEEDTPFGDFVDEAAAELRRVV